jgi:putative toxin-antitoxin system antitoxin component (TIGR02293 family)
MTYICTTIDGKMKKKKPVAKKVIYQSDPPDPPIVSEPAAVYQRQVSRPLPSLNNFSYNEFKKIADTAPFTQAEWAAMLHVSERTLQRYAKNNGHFAPINAERALQIGQVLKKAKEVLGKAEDFYHWIKRKPYALEGQLSLESLTTADGINKVLTQLGRIEHGLFA